MRFGRSLRNVAVGTAVGVGALYVYDVNFNHRVMTRTAYAVYMAGLMAIDYKWNFNAGSDVLALHKRNAERMYRVIMNNKGLYVKIGQSIAIQGNMLPPPYRSLLSKLFDDAPLDTWEECTETLNEAFDGNYREVFESIDHQAVASASIAQVHKGMLRDGREVAVKIQHRDIPGSAKWDLTTYKALVWVFSKFVFEMPMYFAAKYIADQVSAEADFDIELKNAQTMQKLVESDKDTRGRVYVPEVFPDLSTKRVLLMEWIDGTGLANRTKVEQQGYNVKQALQLVFTTLTKEACEWGVVHSDPHPGNWMLRRLPNGKQQLVMLDHGLYVYMGEKLRREYAQLWRAMFKRDLPEISHITHEWGFGDPKLFASATMLQPYDEEDSNVERDFATQEKEAKRMRSFLENSEKIPLALIFVGRTQRILQGLNQMYGSPVNRLHILVDAALKVPGSATEFGRQWRYPVAFRVIDWLYLHLLLISADVTFFVLRIKQFFTHADPEAQLDESIQQSGAALMSTKAK